MQTRRLSYLTMAFAIATIGAAAGAPTDDNGKRDAAAPLREAAAVRPPAIATLRGIVDSVDERSDTITIRLSPERTEPFKVQDGLLFNAVRFGDPVAFSVQTISGLRTIVGLSKE
jgi:hypothetical protein